MIEYIYMCTFMNFILIGKIREKKNIQQSTFEKYPFWFYLLTTTHIVFLSSTNQIKDLILFYLSSTISLYGYWYNGCTLGNAGNLTLCWRCILFKCMSINLNSIEKELLTWKMRKKTIIIWPALFKKKEIWRKITYFSSTTNIQVRSAG